METDMFFHEYTDEEKEGEQWSFEAGAGSYCLINWQT